MMKFKFFVFCFLCQSLPYAGYIPGGLTQGVAIRICGTVSKVARERFVIELQAGPTRDTGLHLHISIRFQENAIVRNSMKKVDEWDRVERYGGFPLVPGQSVRILILAEADHFRMIVNDEHLCDFAHRLPLNTLKFIRVLGDWSVASITREYIGKWVGPCKAPCAN